eukprot:scaffold34537_cov27-Tisochrysis_lutea.AAC.3
MSPGGGQGIVAKRQPGQAQAHERLSASERAAHAVASAAAHVGAAWGRPAAAAAAVPRGRRKPHASGRQPPSAKSSSSVKSSTLG